VSRIGFSSPDFNFSIFFLCLIKHNPKRIKVTRKKPPPRKIETIVEMPSEEREATEGIRKMAKTTNHDKRTITPIFQSRAKIPPKEVATPFPPLNFKNGEKSCPRTPARQTKDLTSMGKAREKYTGRKPLIKSKEKVKKAGKKPRVRRVLAAPMFPLPT
jgi:hypothetical protein